MWSRWQRRLATAWWYVYFGALLLWLLPKGLVLGIRAGWRGDRLALERWRQEIRRRFG